MQKEQEENKTIGECLIEWLRPYEGMDFTGMLTDFIDVPEGTVSLYKTPQRNEIDFVDGSKQITDYYNLFARKSTQEDVSRVENRTMLDELCEWVEEKEAEEDYPTLSDDMTVVEIGVSDSASITSQEDDEAIYQITIAITYVKER